MNKIKVKNASENDRVDDVCYLHDCRHLQRDIVIVMCGRFIQCAHQRIHHIGNADYDEFVSIVCTARNAFYLAPGGIVQFNELLQSLRRSKSCRKELWQRIVSGLATV